MTRNRAFFFALFLVMGFSQGASARDEAGSLESMWIDQAVPSTQASPAAQAPPAVQAKPAIQTVDNNAGTPEVPKVRETRGIKPAPASVPTPPHSFISESSVQPASGTSLSGSASHAPLCSWENFKSSSLLNKGAWPGIGPFKPSDSDSSDLSDGGQNRLKLDVTNDQINHAQLYLSKTEARDFLDIEMSSDFLLEALGVKAKKIAEFNTALEKNKDGLMKGKGLNLLVGHYQINLDRSHAASPYGCLIAVNSLEANRNIIKEHSVSESTDTEKTGEKIAALPSGENKVKTKTNNNSDGKRDNNKGSATKAAAPAADTRREEFVQTIKNWQAIKKVAVSKRDTAHLSEILGGKALARQSDAIKWLVTNKKYYDMVPKGVSVEKYQELTAGKKYSVIASVREFSKLIDDGTGQVLKEVDDKYTVNYTLEKAGDHWNITDSQLLSSVPAGSASPKSAANQKTSH